MNSLDFLVVINDIDDELIQSSLDFLQEDSMNKKRIKRGGLTLSKMGLIAAVLACMLGVTAVAAEVFPSIFTRMKQRYNEEYTKGWAQRRAEVYDRAAEASGDFEPQYIELPELNDSQVIIGETYFDGEALMIAYRFEENMIPAKFDFGPESKDFGKLHNNYSMSGRNETLDDCLEKGLWSQQVYDRNKLVLETNDLQCVKRASSFQALTLEVSPHVTDEDWERVCRDLREHGYVSVVCRNTRIEYDLCQEDGTPIHYSLHRNPTYGGAGRGIDTTEFGNVFFYYDLPEEYREMETLTVYLKITSAEDYHHIDAEKGAKKFTIPVAEVLIPVTLTCAEK